MQQEDLDAIHKPVFSADEREPPVQVFHVKHSAKLSTNDRTILFHVEHFSHSLGFSTGRGAFHVKHLATNSTLC